MNLSIKHLHTSDYDNNNKRTAFLDVILVKMKLT
jgi:hypothetical protein